MAAKKASGLAKLMDPVVGWMARWYQKQVGTELRKYGLRYEDLLDPGMNLDVAEAIRRLPRHEQDMRLQRLKRATDCSLKKQYLPAELQKIQQPFNFYIDGKLAEVKSEMEERAALGTGKPYERTIP